MKSKDRSNQCLNKMDLAPTKIDLKRLGILLFKESSSFENVFRANHSVSFEFQSLLLASERAFYVHNE